jgi:hypothetical protein
MCEEEKLETFYMSDGSRVDICWERVNELSRLKELEEESMRVNALHRGTKE